MARSRLRPLLLLTLPAGLMVGLLLMGMAAQRWLASEAGNRWILKQALTRGAPTQGGLRIGGLTTDAWGTLAVTDVALTDARGAELLAFDRLSVDWSLLGALRGELHLTAVNLAGLRGTLTLQADGSLDVAGLWASATPEESPSDEPFRFPFPIVIEELRLSGESLALQQCAPDAAGLPVCSAWTIHAPALSAAATLRGDGVSLGHLQLDGAIDELGTIGIVASVGTINPRILALGQADVLVGGQSLSLRGGIQRLDGAGLLHVVIDPLHVEIATLPPMLASLVEGLGLNGRIDGRAKLDGPLASPALTLELATDGGPVTLTLGADRAAEDWSLSLEVPQGSDLTPLALRSFADVLPDLALGGRCEARGHGFDASTVDGHVACTVTLGHLPGLGAVDARVNAALTHGRVDIDRFVLDHPGLSADLSGTYRPDTGDLAMTVAAAELDLGLLDHAHDLGVALGLADTVDGLLASRPDLPLTGRVGFAGSVDVVGDRSTVDGTATAEDLVVAGYGSVATLSAPLHLEVGASTTGRIALDAGGVQLDAGALGVPDPGPARLSARVLLGPDAISAEVSAHAEGGSEGEAEGGIGRELVGLVGDFHPDNGQFLLASLSFAPTTALAVRATEPVVGRLVDDGVTGLALALEIAGTNAGQVAVRGDIREQASDATVKLSGLNPAMLEGFWDPEGIEGVVAADLHLGGSFAHPALSGTADVAGLRVPEALRSSDLHVAVDTGSDTVSLTGSLKVATRRVADVAVHVPIDWETGAVAEGPLSGRLVLLPGNAVQWEAVLDGVDLPPFLSSATVDLGGTVAAPELRLVASGRAPVGARDDWTAVSMLVEIADTKATISGDVRLRFVRRAELSGTAVTELPALIRDALRGRAPTSAQIEDAVRDLALDLRVLGLPAEAAMGLAGVDAQLRGALSGGLHVGGSLKAPTFGGGLVLSGGSLGGRPVSPAVFGLEQEAEAYHLTASLGFGDGTGLAVDGKIPAPNGIFASDAQGLDLAVNGEGIPIEAFAGMISGLTDGVGVLQVDGTITGSIDRPVPSLDLRTSSEPSASFLLDDLGVRYLDVVLDAHLGPPATRAGPAAKAAGDAKTGSDASRDGSLALTVHELSFRTERRDRPRSRSAEILRTQPDFEMTGELLLDPDLRPSGLTGDAVLRQMWATATWDQSLRLSGKLCAGTGPRDEACGRGEGARRHSVDGKLQVDDGRFVLSERFFVEGADLELDPHIHFVTSTEEVPPPAEPELEGLDALLASLPDWFTMAINLDLHRSTRADVTMPLLSGGDLTESLSRLRIQCVTDGAIDIGARPGAMTVSGTVRTSDGAATVLGRAFQLSGGSLSFSGADWADPFLDLRAAYDSSYGEVRVNIGGTPTTPSVAFEADELTSQEDILTTLLFGRPLSQDDSSEGQANMAASVLASLAQGAIGQGNSFVDVIQIDATGAVRGGWTLGHGASIYTTLEPWGDAAEVNQVGVTVAWRLPWSLDLEMTTGTSKLSSLGLSRSWHF